MSRSHKRTPIRKDGRSGKESKTIANRIVRRTSKSDADLPEGRTTYKRKTNQYDIHDWIRRTDKSDIEYWLKVWDEEPNDGYYHLKFGTKERYLFKMKQDTHYK